MAEFYQALPFVGAFLLALLLPFAALLQFRLAGRFSADTRVIVLLMLIAIGAILSIALGTRNLDETQDAVNSIRQSVEDAADGFAASRLFNVFILGTSLIEIVRGWLRSRAEPTYDPARPVLLSMLALYLGTILIQATVSEEISFSYKHLYAPLALVAIYYQRIENLPRIVAAIKLAIVILTVGSLAFMLVKPDFVLQRPAASVLPKIDFRLYGLTPHANTMGPIALLGILLELYFPSRIWVYRWIQIVAGFVAFILAQSKTAWVAGVLMIPLVVMPLILARDSRSDKPRDNFSRSILAILVCIAVAVFISLVFARFDVIDYLQRKVSGIGSLTGRTRIWEITLSAWRDNVLFGYGSEVWGIERRIKYHLLAAGMAHNQFIQTLGEAGLVGLGLLLVYMGILTRASIKWFVASRGVMFAIMLLILARCMTEAPMRATDVLSWPLLMHLLVVIMACYYMRHDPALIARPARRYGVHVPIPGRANLIPVRKG